MSDLSVDIANLSPNKRALFELLLTKNGVKLPKIQRIPRKSNSSNSFPLSIAQERVWFLNQQEPDKRVYNIPKAAVRISGALNLEALQKALDAIVARHEVLRTTFADVDGSPRQIIAQRRSVELTISAPGERPEAKPEEQVQHLLEKEARPPFDLSQDLMLRATLLRQSPEEHILLLMMHPIVSDCWSLGILFRELALFYEDFSKGKTPSLPELPIQYADFAHWQRGWQQGDILEEQLSYWKKQLSDSPPVLELPTDRPRSEVESCRRGRQRLVLSATLTKALNSLSLRQEVTLFMTLVTAFVTLLYRYTGQEDILVGTAIAGRTRVELEELIGLFVNTQVLRTDLSGNPAMLELLGRVRDTALAASSHQELPFEKVLEELRPERNLNMNPLFQVMFNLQNAPILKALELSGLTLTSMEVDNGNANSDLTFSMAESEEGLIGFLVYNTELFEENTIDRILRHFGALLEAIVANPEQRLSHLANSV